MKPKSGIVYMAVSDTGKVYIERRKYEHQRDCLKYQNKFSKAIRSRTNGVNDFEWHQLIRVPIEHLDWVEAKFIAEFGSVENGYNTDKTPPVTGSRRGWKPSEETRRKISSTLRGRTHSTETRLKMSRARKGVKFSIEHRHKVVAGRRRAVICITDGRRFDSVRQAEEFYKLKHVGCVCRGARKSAGGFVFRYEQF